MTRRAWLAVLARPAGDEPVHLPFDTGAGQLAIGTTTSQQSATVPVCTQGT